MGYIAIDRELGPKRLELLREVVPTATLIAFLVNPTNSNSWECHSNTESEIDAAFAKLLQLRAGGLVTGNSQQTTRRTRGSPFGPRDLLSARIRRSRPPTLLARADEVIE
jgi:hypothetical protein